MTQRHNWIPLAFLLLGLLLVLRLGIASQATDAERTRLETRITAEQLKIRLESCFDARHRLVHALSHYPWQSQEEIATDWAVRAKLREISSLSPLKGPNG